MKKLNNDIRYIILNELNQMGHSTEDIPINNFLATIKTFIGTEDVGSIKRALQELIKEEYIAESPNHLSKVESINSRGPHETTKNPRRFIQTVESVPKIDDIYLFITLKGKKFLIEWEKLETDTSNSKFIRQTRVITLLMAFAGLGLGIFNLKGCKKDSNKRVSNNKIIIIDSTHINKTEKNTPNIRQTPAQDLTSKKQ